MILTVTATPVGPSPDMLGESPIWDERLGMLYWVDGVSRMIRMLDYATNEVRAIEVPSIIGSIGLTTDPGYLVAGLADGIYRIATDGGAAEPIYVPERANDQIRYNDGKVDRQGRFVCGTMGVNADPVGELIRVSPDGTYEVLANGIRISNAICFSVDGETIYFADSLDRTIRACSYTSAPEPLARPRVHLDTSIFNSGPDGATVDSEGFLWVALVNSRKIGRFAPDGTLERLIQAPVDMPSCIGFGGPDMSTLYMTSIKDSGSGRAISRHPNGGYLFALEGLGVTGIPEPLYG